MIKFFAVSLFILILSLKAFASPQSPDYIIYKGDTLATYTLLLEQYFQLQAKADQGQLFGLSFRDGSTFNCWRGYQAIYKLDNDSLFLVDIISCGERRNGIINKAASTDKMKSIFKDKFINDRVYIDWFSGDMKFPLTNKVLRWDGVFYTIYEREKVFSISNGNVLTIQDVENYVDDPNRIDRKDKNKISDILFKKLKKAKWKNKDDFDCSTKYMVTIDENGNVLKVKMLYSDEEIEKYYEKDEYNFCIKKLYDALKSLKFDIIKDKGRPIAEDIYIEIWIDDNGKIENWTR
jgi:hypothetical protein